MRSDVRCYSVVEDGPHTDVMKGPITNRTRNDLTAFVAGRTHARIRRKNAIFAAGWSRLLKTPANYWLCVAALRVFLLMGVVYAVDTTQLAMW